MLAATNQQMGQYLLTTLVLIVGLLLLLRVRWRPRLLLAGYPGLMGYLRCVPRTDAQKRDALDLVMRGVVVFFIGLALPPLFIVGLVLFYYGLRKLCMIWMGLEILEDSHEPTGEPHGQPAATDAAP